MQIVFNPETSQETHEKAKILEVNGLFQLPEPLIEESKGLKTKRFLQVIMK